MKHASQGNILSWLAEGKWLIGLLPAILVSWWVTQQTYRSLNETTFREPIQRVARPPQVARPDLERAQALRDYSRRALEAAGVWNAALQQQFEATPPCLWIGPKDTQNSAVQSVRIFWKLPSRIENGASVAEEPTDDTAEAKPVDPASVIPVAVVHEIGGPNAGTLSRELSQILLKGIVGQPQTFCVLHMVSDTRKRAQVTARLYAIETSAVHETGLFVRPPTEHISVLDWDSAADSIPGSYLCPVTVMQSPDSLAQQFSSFAGSFIASNTERSETMPESRKERDAYLNGLRLFTLCALEEAYFWPLPASNRHFKPTVVSWTRVMNGSDGWGVIQWSTVFSFWLGVLLLAVRTLWLIVEIAWRWALQRHARLGRTADFAPPRLLRPLASAIQVPMIQAITKGALLDEATARSPESVYEDFSNRQYNRSWIPRFLTGAIPSIGFIGTVVGIGLALLGVGDVMSGDAAKSRVALELISTQLGTAFDTTLVALVTSLALLLFVHMVQAWEDIALHRALHIGLDLRSPCTELDIEKDPDWITHATNLITSTRRAYVVVVALAWLGILWTLYLLS